MARSKYNVDHDSANRTYDGIVFDSVMEMKFYRDVLCPEVESGLVKRYDLQKEFVLQPKFTRDGKTVRPITYVADFYIEYIDGRKIVIDTKGCPDAKAMIKRKMMWYVYPDVDYAWMTYVKKYGGWIEYELAKKLRREAKRAKKLKEEQENGKED